MRGGDVDERGRRRVRGSRGDAATRSWGPVSLARPQAARASVGSRNLAPQPVTPMLPPDPIRPPGAGVAPPPPAAPLVVVAGATGRLGRHVVGALVRRGWRVRALTRAPARAAHLGAHDVVQADLARPAAGALARACAGAQAVFSCAGASLDLHALRDRTSFAAVDRDGNLALVAAARRAGVQRFAYVSLFGGRPLRATAYAAAHEAVADALAAGPLPWAVVRPTAFFSSFDEALRQAAAGGAVVVGDGLARTNPIAEADLAELCAAAVLDGEGDVPAGGPVTYTRREIAELAASAAGRAPRVRHVPPGALRAAARLLGAANPRLAALVEFGARASVTDAVAPAYGTRELGAYLAERAAALRGDTAAPAPPRAGAGGRRADRAGAPAALPGA